MIEDIKLPEVGEGITSGTVINIAVNVGDSIKEGQDLIELETDKASLPVPSPINGVVTEILVKSGDEIPIGATILKAEAGAVSTDQVKQAEQPAKEQPVNEQEEPQQAKQPTAPVAQQPITQAPTPHAIEPTIPSKEESDKDTQVVIIGGGPGGYSAAFLAADLGLDVSLVDLDINPGGVCLYRGCIPSKALLHAAKAISESREAKDFGIDFGEPKIDLEKLRNWKNDVVKRLTGGLGQLSKQRKINYIQGRAKFVDSNTLTIEKEDGTTQELTYERAVLATGSSPIALPFAPKSKRVLDSTSALNLESIPKNMLLIGGGYIGLELGIVYAELGSEVSVVEMLPQLMNGADRDVANVLEKRLKTSMKDIMTNTKVAAMEETDDGIKVTFEDKDAKQTSQVYEKVLIAIGRKPNSKDIGLENTKVKVNDRGFVEANQHLQTTDTSIYAIGDIIGNPMLAHKASHEGRVAVEHIAGHKVAFEPNGIPAVVFTDPEIAWVGLTETEAKEKGINYTVAKMPWAASGRAMTLDRIDGLTKLLVDPQTERILGVSIVGPGAGELIAEGALALEMGANATDLKLTIHPHPTLSETIMEAAESFFGQSTHMYKPKKK